MDFIFLYKVNNIYKKYMGEGGATYGPLVKSRQLLVRWISRPESKLSSLSQACASLSKDGAASDKTESKGVLIFRSGNSQFLTHPAILI